MIALIPRPRGWSVDLPAGFIFLVIAQCLVLPASHADDMVIVLNSRDDSMSIIDPKTYTETRRVHIGKGPHHLLPTPDNQHLIIANTVSNDLVAVNPGSGDIVRRIPRIPDPYHLGFSPDGKWFVANGNRLDRVDIYHYENLEFRLAKKVLLPDVPSHMTFTRDNVVYVTLQESNEVAAIRLVDQSIIWKTGTGPAPAGVWVTPDESRILVAATAADFVEIFDSKDGRKLGQFRTGNGAHNFLAMGDRRHILISNRVEGSISIIDQESMKVTETFSVPGGPDDMELNADGTELWVTTRWRNQVAVIDMATRTIKKKIKVGRSPHGIFRKNHAPRV